MDNCRAGVEHNGRESGDMIHSTTRPVYCQYRRFAASHRA